MQHRQVVQRLWRGRLLNTTPLSLSHTHVEREIKTSITQYTCNDDVYELWMSCTIVCGEGGKVNAVPTNVSKRCHRLLQWVCISLYTNMYTCICTIYNVCIFACFFFASFWVKYFTLCEWMTLSCICLNQASRKRQSGRMPTAIFLLNVTVVFSMRALWQYTQETWWTWETARLAAPVLNSAICGSCAHVKKKVHGDLSLYKCLKASLRRGTMRPLESFWNKQSINRWAHSQRDCGNLTNQHRSNNHCEFMRISI